MNNETNQILIDIDSVLNELTEWVKHNMPISPDAWISSALKMNLLKEPLIARKIALESSLANKRLNLLEDGKSVAYARTALEAHPDYAECRTLEARVKMIEEQIRLAKHRARMAQDDYNSN